MFCSNCGNNIENESKFCPYCGNPVKINNINNTKPFTNTAMPAQQMQPSMKWYKFLIYFQLFAGALMNISSLGSIIEDKLNYENDKNQLLESIDFGTSYYDELTYIFEKTDTFLNICIVLAICSALTSIVAIAARQKLAHYKMGAPKLLLIYYGLILEINLVVTVSIHILIPREILENATSNLFLIYVQIIVGIVMFICNKIYFKKREYMFCN